LATLVRIEVLGTPLLLLLLVLLARTARENAAAGAYCPAAVKRGLSTWGGAMLWFWTTRAGLGTLALLAAVLAANVLQSGLDPALTRALGYDLTGAMHALEGDAVAALQRALLPLVPEPALRALGVFYLAGFVATMLLPLALFHGPGPGCATVRRAWLSVFVVSYALAQPFYAFAPVVEVGWSELATARPLLDELWPRMTPALRGGSALDNCLPSLHVSCTVAAWWCGRRLTRAGLPARGLRRAAGSSAALTTAVVLLLGIHWLVDAAAGVAFGIACAELGLRVSRRFGGPALEPATAAT